MRHDILQASFLEELRTVFHNASCHEKIQLAERTQRVHLVIV